MIRGVGWKRDVFDARDWKARMLFGAPLRLPADALDLVRFVDRPNDQGDSSSCVGQAIGKAIHVRLRKLGVFDMEPSCLGIYTTARRIGLANPASKLEDEGCYPRDAMKGINLIGVSKEEAWPFDLARVNAELPFDVLQGAARFSVFSWYRIDAWGASRPSAVAQALSKGYPVVFGMELWEAFFDYREGTITGVVGKDSGGHMMLIVGYRTRFDGKMEFLLLNSWGTTWGEAGYAWLHEDLVANQRASDFNVIQVAA